MIDNCFIWNDDLITGFENIDTQHRKIFNYLNVLILAEKGGETQSLATQRTLDDLINYALIHFEEEEMVLKNKKYPYLAEHQKLHYQFSEKIFDLQERNNNGEIILPELIHFVKIWLLDHILTEDMKALKF